MSSSATEVLTSIDHEGVAVVTLNRPEKLNALTPDTHLRYAKTLHDLDLDPEVRAIVVTGAGRGWCAGADLGWLAGLAAGDVPATQEAELAGVDVGWTMTIDTPLIAAVNGAVAGMGFSMMLAADMRYATSGAKISSTFARLGLGAEWGSSWLLPRLVGLANAAEILLTGNSYTAEEMFKLGVVQRVCAPDELLPAAMDWARGIATQCSPRSTATIKQQLRDVANQTPSEAFVDSVAIMLDSFGWPDLAEAVTARVQKRPPVFPPYSSHQPKGNSQ